MDHPEVLFERLRKNVVATIAKFHLLSESDKVMVAVSGGKDSTILLLILEDIRRRAPFPFTLQAVLLDQKQPGFDATAYTAWLKAKGLDLIILNEDTYSIVKDKVAVGKSYCGLCSRLRRGILYNYAHEHGYTKIALGHHRDDANQTLLMNLFYVGRLAAMPPKLLSDDRRNVVIRPLAEISEDSLKAYAAELTIPVIPCNLCGSQENLKRQEMKDLLRQLETKHPGLQASMLTAMQNVKPTQLFDSTLQDFAGLGSL